MWPLRLLQVSDLHFGTREEPEIEEDLRSLVRRIHPELVIASGDLTHSNTRGEHERAAAFLRSLGPPLLAVPGNHDMPRWPPRRFTATFDEYLRVWGEGEPVYRSDSVVVCGLNSVRPWKQQGGALAAAQLARVADVFAEAPRSALRVVAVHHHLLGAPWRTAKRSIANRSRVLGGLVDAGAELIVSGHVHQSAIGERREFEVVAGKVQATTVVTAPGLGQPRPKRRGEARGLHVFEADEETIRVLTYAWVRGRGNAHRAWARIAERLFPRGAEPLQLAE